MVYDTFPEKVDAPCLMSRRLSAYTRNVSHDIAEKSGGSIFLDRNNERMRAAGEDKEDKGRVKDT